MVVTRRNYVVGAFEDQAAALRAVQALRDMGVREDQLAVVAREWVRGAAEPSNVKAQHRGGNAAVTGAATGAAVGAAAAVGLSLIPGLGFIAAGGLLASALGGAAFGAAAGAFVGPFIALELTEEEAECHARDVAAGRTVVVVRTNDQHERIHDTLLKYGAYDERINPN